MCVDFCGYVCGRGVSDMMHCRIVDEMSVLSAVVHAMLHFPAPSDPRAKEFYGMAEQNEAEKEEERLQRYLESNLWSTMSRSVVVMMGDDSTVDSTPCSRAHECIL